MIRKWTLTWLSSWSRNGSITSTSELPHSVRASPVTAPFPSRRSTVLTYNTIFYRYVVVCSCGLFTYIALYSFIVLHILLLSLGSFHFWLSWIMLLWTLSYDTRSTYAPNSVPAGVGLLDHRVGMGSAFTENAKLFSKVLVFHLYSARSHVR